MNNFIILIIGIYIGINLGVMISCFLIGLFKDDQRS